MRSDYAHNKHRRLLSWPTLPAIIVPHRLRRKLRTTRSKLRSRQSPASSITALSTSFNPAHTLRALQRHQWSYYDLQYLLLAAVGITAFAIIQTPGPILKAAVATLLMTALALPITRQFFLPFLPIAAWLVFFDAMQFISGEYRPPIWVRVLPALENILFGANLSNILSAHKAVALDVLAWLPYGGTHFAAPFLCAAFIFIFGPPGSTPAFARAFGYMNLAGVTIQLLFPCSAPWYENMYGLAPADYTMHGSPAGLAAIDKLFGVDLYTSTFTASPVVFGAFPSLHSACATLEALFMSHFFPKLRPVFVAYTLWLWWATMYLSHHYAVDLVGGSLLSTVVYFIARSKFIPRLQAGKTYRWDYDYVEHGESNKKSDDDDAGYTLAELRDEGGFGRRLDSDEWTIGSSSSFASSSRSSSLASPLADESSHWDTETLTSPNEQELYSK